MDNKTLLFILVNLYTSTLRRADVILKLADAHARDRCRGQIVFISDIAK